MRKQFLSSAGFLAIGAISATIGWHIIGPMSAVGGSNADTYRQLNLFGDVFDRIRSDYVEVPDDEKLVDSAISGMLCSGAVTISHSPTGWVSIEAWVSARNSALSALTATASSNCRLLLIATKSRSHCASLSVPAAPTWERALRSHSRNSKPTAGREHRVGHAAR